MRQDKDLAIKLRKQKKSYNEISRILGVAKSTLTQWFKNDLESQKIKLFLSNKENKLVAERIKKFAATSKLKWEKWREQGRNEALTSFSKLAKNPLFVAGLMLYWAEGDNKLKNPIRFTNTDPRMVSLYIRFLTQALNVPQERLRATMILYPDLSEEKCFKFWSLNTNLPRSQFYKTQYIKGKHPTIRLSNGICMIMYSSRLMKEKIIVWIDLLSKKL